MADDKEMEYGPDIITLVDEDNKEIEFEVLDVLDQDGNTYYALVPAVNEESLEESNELVILKVMEENGEEYLTAIEDDDEYEDISDIFMDRLADDFEFDAE